MGNGNSTPPFTEGQINANAIIRTVFSVPSLVAASYIIQHVLRSPKRRNRVFTRVMLGMSSMDLIFAFTQFCSTWPCPKEMTQIPYAIGTWTSCQAFAFLEQGSRLATILYNGCLALYFLLSIRYEVTERLLRQRVDVWLHAVPLVLAWSTAVVPLVDDAYNPSISGCKLLPYPYTCRNPAAGVPCARGANAGIYGMALFIAPLWTVFVFLVVAMLMIYHKVSRVEAATKRLQGSTNGGRLHSDVVSTSDVPETETEDTNGAAGDNRQLDNGQPDGDESGISSNICGTKNETGTGNGSGATTSPRTNHSSSRQNSVVSSPETFGRLTKLKKRFAFQALLYCLAYMLTWVWATAAVIFGQFLGSPVYYGLGLTSTMFTSLGGFWNALIYIRPRYLRYRERQLHQQQQEEQRQQRLALRQQTSDHEDGGIDSSMSSLPATSTVYVTAVAGDNTVISTAENHPHPESRIQALVQAVGAQGIDDDEDEYEAMDVTAMTRKRERET